MRHIGVPRVRLVATLEQIAPLKHRSKSYIFNTSFRDNFRTRVNESDV